MIFTRFINFKMLRIREFGRFAGVGIFMLIFSVLSSYLLLEVYKFRLYNSYITLYLVSIFISYYLNSKFTFKKQRSLKNGIQYYTLYLFGLFIGLMLLKICDSIFEYSNFILTLIVIIPRTVLIYILMKLIIFKNN